MTVSSHLRTYVSNSTTFVTAKIEHEVERNVKVIDLSLPPNT